MNIAPENPDIQEFGVLVLAAGGDVSRQTRSHKV
jgi:hypothetical protein